MKLLALYKLFRVKPVVAWSVSGFILAVSVAIHEFGFNLNWDYLGLSLLVVIIIQAFLAHAINDIFDEDVDRITDMKGTNRFKVLVEGLATRGDLFTVSILSIVSVLLSSLYLYMELGYYILVFGAIGLYVPLAYSVKPLRLGWKPFSEWTIVFPTLITLVVAVNYVATGFLSILAFYTGVLFALFSITWFLISRYMDYEPDKKAGKITSAVMFGIDWFIIYYYFILITLLFIVGGLSLFNLLFIPSLGWALLIVNLSNLNFMNPFAASALRTKLIIISTLNSLMLSALFISF